MAPKPRLDVTFRYRAVIAIQSSEVEIPSDELGLNYAGAVLASELLARIATLEERLSRYEPPTNRSR